MARVDYIRYAFFDASLGEQDELVWTKQKRVPIERLPQIFWADGRGWPEANIWGLERATNVELNPETVKRTMKHLRRYADFLEAEQMDWRHFPVRKDEQPLRKFRKQLLDEVDRGELMLDTARNCMAAAIQFHRFAYANDLVDTATPMWTDRVAIIPFIDSKGFKRTMARLKSDLSIPNRRRIGTVLEDGLLPLRSQHMTELLRFTARSAVKELHLMLGTGFFTGARIGTITTMTVTCLETAREHSEVQGLYLLPVGPGTGIATKFSVNGDIHLPKAVLDDLKHYATSTSRLLREAKADPSHKNLLFLTRSGKPYTVAIVNRLVHVMRMRAVGAGMRYMHRFKFHQSRATFGTWLMQLILDAGGKANAIRFVRDAMLHADERTTLGYITFLEDTRAKVHFSAEFNAAFTGLVERDWNSVNA